MARRLTLACLGATIAKVAAATGITRGTVRRYCAGLAEPEPRSMERLCGHSGISRDDRLLYGRGGQRDQPDSKAEELT